MAIDWADVEGIAPELSDIPWSGRRCILAYVNNALDEDAWGGEESVRLARIYLAAHYGTITRQGGNGPSGPVVSESVGDLSRQYAAASPMGTDPLMDTTPYGKSFRGLLRRSLARLPIVL